MKTVLWVNFLILSLTGCSVTEMYKWYDHDKNDPLGVERLYYMKEKPGVYVGNNTGNWVLVEEKSDGAIVRVWIEEEGDVTHTIFEYYSAELDSFNVEKRTLSLEGVSVESEDGEILVFQGSPVLKRMHKASMETILNWLFKTAGYGGPYGSEIGNEAEASPYFEKSR